MFPICMKTANCWFTLSPMSCLHDYLGDCHLTEWSHWSTCELACIDGRSFETMGRQTRSRTFLIQSLENQDSCPQQVLETRPCAGTKNSFYSLAQIDQCLFCFQQGIIELLLSYLLAGGKCYQYTWKTGLWDNNERTVWCQRSDGINVTGIPVYNPCGTSSQRY